jgi:ankyrin repeat protein
MEAESYDKQTPLHLAAMNGHDSTVRLLGETLGTNMDAKDRNKRTCYTLQL